MIRPGKASSLTFFPVVLFCLALLFPAQAAFAAKTIFLPPIVKSFGDTSRYTSLIDSDIRKGLAGTDITYPTRQEAASLANYNGTWPPPMQQLKKIAAAARAENIIVGTTTAVGREFSLDVKYFDLLSPENPVFFYQTAANDADLPRAVKALVNSIQQYNNREFTIASIAPQGNNRIDSGAILRKVSTRKGDIYNQTALRNDLKEIFNMGYFDDVQIDVEDSARGKKVIFRVKEKPVITSVTFIGIAEVKEADVKGAANFREHLILNPVQIDAAKKAILQLYKTKGFYNSTVTTKVKKSDKNGVSVDFIIHEGEKIYIKDIKVEGNTAFSDSEILDQIQTGTRWFMSWLTDSGLLDQTKIKQDSTRIAAFYADNGYLDARVGDPMIKQEGEWLYIIFNIEEGSRYRVGTVGLTGDDLGDRRTLLDLLTVRNEKYVSRKTVRDDILKLTDFFAERGYAFASIKPRFNKAEGNRMDINFDIDKGNLVYIDRIIIRGNTRTHDNVIRRELHIKEGGIFDAKALRESSKGLQRLQFFEEANITPEPSMNPDRMTIVINVKEKSTGAFSIGAGYSSADNLLFMGQISENNFLGRGDSVSLSATVGGSSSRYNLGYTNPHLNDSDLSWGVDLFKTYYEYDDYTKDSTGAGLRVGYPLWEKWRIYGNYSLTSTDLSDLSDDASYIITNSVDIHLTSAFKLSLVRDSRNQKFNATDGSRNSLSVEYAGGPLAGDAQFTKVEASSGWYFPVWEKTAFHVKGAAGQVFENETDKLPVYERFYLGGLSSVRGFKYATISPTDPDTDEDIGGDKMWYSNVEFIFPLLSTAGLNGLVFFDSGQVYDDDENFFSETDNIKKAAGFGVNWLSPMGPLQLVLGFNLDPLEDEEDSVFDFSIGGTF